MYFMMTPYSTIGTGRSEIPQVQDPARTQPRLTPLETRDTTGRGFSVLLGHFPIRGEHARVELSEERVSRGIELLM